MGARAFDDGHLFDADRPRLRGAVAPSAHATKGYLVDPDPHVRVGGADLHEVAAFGVSQLRDEGIDVEIAVGRRHDVHDAPGHL